jgi:steroid delta-isomerase-like uncharacterized protein
MTMQFNAAIIIGAFALTGSCSTGSFADTGAIQHSAHHCAPAQIARNEAIVRIVFDDILSNGRIQENEHLYAPDFVAHGLSGDSGRAEDREATRGWRAAAPDIKITILRLVANCEMVSAHWEGTGTNTGVGNGLPATGRKIRAQGVTFFQFRHGKIAEEWSVFDQYTMLRQLDLLK